MIHLNVIHTIIVFSMFLLFFSDTIDAEELTLAAGEALVLRTKPVS